MPSPDRRPVEGHSVDDVGAEARRAGLCAVSAREAPSSYVVPPRVVWVVHQQVVDPFGLHRTDHVLGGRGEQRAGFAQVFFRGLLSSNFGERRLTTVGTGRDQIPVAIFARELRDRDVEAGFAGRGRFPSTCRSMSPLTWCSSPQRETGSPYETNRCDRRGPIRERRCLGLRWRRAHTI